MTKQSTTIPVQESTHTHQSPCPRCGFCPHCGRSNESYPHWPYGSWPYYWPSTLYPQVTYMTDYVTPIGGISAVSTN